MNAKCSSRRPRMFHRSIGQRLLQLHRNAIWSVQFPGLFQLQHSCNMLFLFHLQLQSAYSGMHVLQHCARLHIGLARLIAYIEPDLDGDSHRLHHRIDDRLIKPPRCCRSGPISDPRKLAPAGSWQICQRKFRQAHVSTESSACLRHSNIMVAAL